MNSERGHRHWRVSWLSNPSLLPSKARLLRMKTKSMEPLLATTMQQQGGTLTRTTLLPAPYQAGQITSYQTLRSKKTSRTYPPSRTTTISKTMCPPEPLRPTWRGRESAPFPRSSNPWPNRSPNLSAWRAEAPAKLTPGETAAPTDQTGPIEQSVIPGETPSPPLPLSKLTISTYALPSVPSEPWVERRNSAFSTAPPKSRSAPNRWERKMTGSDICTDTIADANDRLPYRILGSLPGGGSTRSGRERI